MALLLLTRQATNTSADCSKIARFVRTCDAYAIPVVTFVDTEGFKADDETEAYGAVKDMAKLCHAYAEATTIKLAVVTGKAYGPAFIALAGKGSNADLSLLLIPLLSLHLLLLLLLNSFSMTSLRALLILLLQETLLLISLLRKMHLPLLLQRMVALTVSSLRTRSDRHLWILSR